MNIFKRNKKPDIHEIVKKLVSDANVNFASIYETTDDLTENHDVLASDFYSLRNELATNGVVRDLRDAQKTIKQLLADNEALHARFAQLESNGVATAINKLNAEVFEKKKSSLSHFNVVMYKLAGVEVPSDATLAGKVDAIIEHLGVEVSVKPKEVIPSKIVTTKKKTAKKKGGRR